MKDRSLLNPLAVEHRRDWEIDPYGPIDLFSIVISKISNLTLLFFPMSNNTSGMSIKENENMLIAINSSMTYGRQRFTLAHELYHLFYEKGFNKLTICDNLNQNDSEKEADSFASYLLMPQEGLIRYKKSNNVENWDLDEIINAEQYFQISHTAMLMRLKEINFIDQIEFNKFKNVIISYEASIRGFSNELYIPSPKDKEYFLLGNYIRSIEKLDSLNKLTNGKKRELLLNGFRGDIVFKTQKGG